MKIFALILMTLAVASADVVLDGACPAVEPVQNFDLKGYAGTWYHAKKIPVINEGNGKCESAVYTLDGDSLKLKYAQISDGEEVYVNGIANKADDANGAAKLILNIYVEDTAIEQPVWILDTDYTKYSISYNCKYDEESNTHKLNLWVLSRTMGLEDDAKAAVDAFISSKFGNIDASKFFEVEVSEDACKFEKSREYTTPTEQ